MYTVTVSLSNSPDAPTLDLLTGGQRWNGNLIVIATAAQIADHLAALQSNDRNGTWDELRVFADDALDALFLHSCEVSECEAGEHRYSPDIDIVIGEDRDTQGAFAVTGLDWTVSA